MPSMPVQVQVRLVEKRGGGGGGGGAAEAAAEEDEFWEEYEAERWNLYITVSNSMLPP